LDDIIMADFWRNVPITHIAKNLSTPSRHIKRVIEDQCEMDYYEAKARRDGYALGTRHGYQTVTAILPGPKSYRLMVKCDCGKTHAVALKWFRTRCGVRTFCSKSCAIRLERDRIDRAGERFGMLVVLRRSEDNPLRWVVLCDCGNETTVDRSNLRTGRSQSCGCQFRELNERRARYAAAQRTP